MQNLRHPEILELVRKGGKVSVEGLAAHFGVTFQTIRRDLSELAEAGHLHRVHGGAVVPSGIHNIAYAERRALNASSKAAIGRACAKIIPDGASVFLNIGTTTEAVADALSAHDALFVVTNNLNVAQRLTAHQGSEVVVTGGQLRKEDGGLVGQGAVASVRDYRLDFAVVGCSALDPTGDMLDFDMAEVAVSRTILAQARRTILVADHSKFQRNAPCRIASVTELDMIVTDVPLSASLRQACDGNSTEVVIA